METKREIKIKNFTNKIIEDTKDIIDKSKTIKDNYLYISKNAIKELEVLYNEKIETYSKSSKIRAKEIKFIKFKDNIYLVFGISNKSFKYNFYAKHICNYKDVISNTKYRSIKKYLIELNKEFNLEDVE